MFIADSVVLVLLAASGNSHLVERNAWPAPLIFLRRLYCSAATGPVPLARAIAPTLHVRAPAAAARVPLVLQPRTLVANLRTLGSRAGGAIVIPLARVLTAVFATAMRANHLYSAETT